MGGPSESGPRAAPGPAPVSATTLRELDRVAFLLARKGLPGEAIAAVAAATYWGRLAREARVSALPTPSGAAAGAQPVDAPPAPARKLAPVPAQPAAKPRHGGAGARVRRAALRAVRFAASSSAAVDEASAAAPGSSVPAPLILAAAAPPPDPAASYAAAATAAAARPCTAACSTVPQEGSAAACPPPAAEVQAWAAALPPPQERAEWARFVEERVAAGLGDGSVAQALAPALGRAAARVWQGTTGVTPAGREAGSVRSPAAEFEFAATLYSALFVSEQATAKGGKGTLGMCALAQAASAFDEQWACDGAGVYTAYLRLAAAVDAVRSEAAALRLRA